jgi:hypothetical protein
MVFGKALQNWKIFVNSYPNDYTISAKLTKRLIAFNGEWYLANGAQSCQMAHKIQFVNEDFDIA